MRRRAVAGLVAVLLAAGLGACGDDAGGGGAEDAGGRPLLPSSGGGGGAAAGAESQAMAKSAAADGSGVAADAMIAPVQPVEYRLADGAKAPADDAPAYRVLRSGSLERTDVVEALGLDAADAERVEVESGLGWFYGGKLDESVSSGVAVACEPDADCPVPPEPEPPAGVPTAAEAEARFRKTLDGLGIDAEKGTITVDDGTDLFARSVQFTPEVDGRPVAGLETTVSYGGEGRVEYAQGFTGRFEKLGDYPLVPLAEAFRRFQEGMGGGGAPEPMVGGATSAEAEPAEDGGPVMTIEPETMPPPAPLEPRIVEVTGAEVVLQLVYPACEDGDYLVVPAFRLQTDDESMTGFDVPAVTDDSLEDPSAADDRDAAPCPEDVAEDPPADPAGRPEPATTVDGDAGAGSAPGEPGSIEPAPAPSPPDQPKPRP